MDSRFLLGGRLQSRVLLYRVAMDSAGASDGAGLFIPALLKARLGLNRLHIWVLVFSREASLSSLRRVSCR